MLSNLRMKGRLYWNITIIEHLGGTIGVESEMGNGSRFWFTHPLRLNQREKTKEIISK